MGMQQRECGQSARQFMRQKILQLSLDEGKILESQDGIEMIYITFTSPIKKQINTPSKPILRILIDIYYNLLYLNLLYYPIFAFEYTYYIEAYSHMQSQIITVLVSSQHKGCRLMEKILQNNRFKCIFSNNHGISIEKIDILIIDDHHDSQQLSSNEKFKTIVLKDTEKSPASILALSGQLSTFGQNQKHQFVPSYLIDFVVGIGLSILILQMQKKVNTSKEQHKIFVSIIELAHYFGAFNISAKQNGFLRNPLGKNMLDGGTPFYRLYQCREGVIAVGNLEPKFYQEMIKAFKFDFQIESYLLKNQFNTQEWNKITQILGQNFMKKSAYEWSIIMSDYDTCVTEVIQNTRQVQNPQPKIYLLNKSRL